MVAALLMACSSPGVLEVEPCMSLASLAAKTSGLDPDEFYSSDFGERISEDPEWERLVFKRGPTTIFEADRIRAWVVAYEGRVSAVCTRRIWGGAIRELPGTVGRIRSALLEDGFIVTRASPGALAEPTNELLVRSEIFRRGDYTVRVTVDTDWDRSYFHYDLCFASFAACRSPAQARYEREHEHLDETVPMVPVQDTPPTTERQR